ncbi:SAVMC3_10250 family protein [Streptomyces sp. NPDC048603]|uniref:SAVMC3_10250 family protein n=1 Tax=Streptomyces sp. NPDC048603 TaxID=3365577 RepID=UPI00371156F1
MRELIYLSDGKLHQFVPAARRTPRTGALRLTTPVGGIDVDAPAADAERQRLRRLDQVDRHLQESARWFAEPDLRPGQWVQFEAPLHCVTLGGTYRNLVLFADTAPGREPEHDREAGCRLLMHGSAHHLLGHAPVPVEGPPLERYEDFGSSYGSVFLTHAGRVVAALAAASHPAPGEAEPPAGDPEPAGEAVGPAGRDGVLALLRAIDSSPVLDGTAVWMRGYARVTVLPGADPGTPRCVVASPLTVEVAPDLP